MTPTETPAVRDKERTRRAILDAAERLWSDRGSAVSLAEIAATAEVSKSGLLHHFSSREALLLAIVEDMVQRIWSEVHSRVDLSENHAGKLTRAYVRTLTDESGGAMQVYASTSMLGTLGNAAGVDEVLERDAHAWREAFAADGLELGRSLVIRSAAEGLAALANSAYLAEDELTAARQELLDLTVG